MKNKIFITIIVCLLTITGLMLCILAYIGRSVSDIASQEDARTYDTHYILISDDTSDQWQSIYESAKAEAAENGAYLEWIGVDEQLPVNYDTADCLRIAVADKADGIILHHNSGEYQTDLIDAAARQGIPVITVLEDDPDSTRVSYIGVNGYQMGEIYAEKILDDLKTGQNKVAVLLNTSVKDSSSSLMYSQLVRTVDQLRKDDQEVVFSVYEIDSTTSFDAEEGIRDIFLKGYDLPDIIICQDLVSTECVMQALIDFNQVGNITLLGYYASDKIKEGIRKGIIEATLLMDTDEIGRKCIEALDEYRQLGRVNSYYNVGVQLITNKTLLREEYQN